MSISINKYLFTAMAAVLSLNTLAQVQRGGVPVSWNLEEVVDDNHSFISLPEIDVEALLLEDALNDDQKHVSQRFAYAHSVALDLDNSGRWTNLQNGDRIWQLAIYGEGASSLSVTFSDFFLPKGSVMYIYTPDRSEIIGAFTSANNKNTGVFSSVPIHGEEIIIEYYEPFSRRNDGRLTLRTIAQAYRGMETSYRDSNPSSSCHVNARCPENSRWFEASSSTVLLTLGDGTRWASGVLLNNSSFSGRPLILTSYSALHGDPGAWVCTFNHTSLTCSPSSSSKLNMSISGARLLESDIDSDVALIELSLQPLVEWRVQYAGWDASSATPKHVTSLHHPGGDVQKLAHHSLAPAHGFYNGKETWQIDNWYVGTTETGSLGAPLFDENKRVVGWFYAGGHSCITPGIADHFCKFSDAWHKLEKYLDPFNAGYTAVDGFYPGFDQIDQEIIEKEIGLFPNPTADRINVFNDTEEGFLSYTIFDMHGKILSEEDYSGGPIYLGTLQPGAYVLQLQLSESIIRRKVIVRP